MTDLENFIPYVLPYVRGAGEPAVLKAVRDACIDFCVRSDLVQRVTPQDITATTEDYAVTPPSQMQMARAIAVMWQGRWFTVVGPDQVQSDVALRGVTIGTAVPLSGNPQYFFQKTPTALSVSVYPIPDTTLVNGLTIKASFKPTQVATQVEDVLFNEYAEQIAAGAIGRLMAVPGQTYSSSAGVGFMAFFEKGVGDAKRRKVWGNVTINARVRPVPFV